MYHLKKIVALSVVTTSLVAGGYYYNHQNSVSKKNEQKIESTAKVNNLDLLASNKPVEQVTGTNGEVEQEFVNRFNQAVNLDKETGRFVINNDLIPKNATEKEISSLNSFVQQTNADLDQMQKNNDDANTVQTGKSLVIANDAQTAQSVANNSLITNVSRYHYGSTYVHVYWWGLRIGLNKGDLALAIGAGCVVGGVYIPVRVAQVVLGLVGLTADKLVPGGIVFNSSPQVGQSIWGVEWQ